MSITRDLRSSVEILSTRDIPLYFLGIKLHFIYLIFYHLRTRKHFERKQWLLETFQDKNRNDSTYLSSKNFLEYDFCERITWSFDEPIILNILTAIQAVWNVDFNWCLSHQFNSQFHLQIYEPIMLTFYELLWIHISL